LFSINGLTKVRQTVWGVYIDLLGFIMGAVH